MERSLLILSICALIAGLGLMYGRALPVRVGGLMLFLGGACGVGREYDLTGWVAACAAAAAVVALLVGPKYLPLVGADRPTDRLPRRVRRRLRV